MKKLLFLGIVCSFLSCSSDDKTITEDQVNLVLDHFKTTSVLYGTALLASEDGSPTFEIPYIDGFDFLPGRTAQITATKTTIKNAGTNATSSSYRLMAVQTQDTIPPNTRFTVPLAKFVNGFGYVTFVVGSAEYGYVLSNEIPIDCNSFCGELSSRLIIEDPITGEFEHGPDGSYVLMALY